MEQIFVCCFVDDCWDGVEFCFVGGFGMLFFYDQFVVVVGVFVYDYWLEDVKFVNVVYQFCQVFWIEVSVGLMWICDD